MYEIMSLPELVALFIFCAVMTLSPGPNTMLTTAIASNEGLRKAIPFTLAVPIGWLLILLITGLGIGTLVIQLPILRWFIQIAGCAYLLWLAYLLSRHRQLQTINSSKLKITFIKGVALQFLNIKVWLLTVTVTSTWIINAEGQTSINQYDRLALACFVVMFFAFASNFSYALIGALVGNWLLQGKRLLIFNRILAALLAATAIWTLFI
jgi:threonine/homoserine/homoserine lactone efflux protein